MPQKKVPCITGVPVKPGHPKRNMQKQVTTIGALGPIGPNVQKLQKTGGAITYRLR